MIKLKEPNREPIPIKKMVKKKEKPTSGFGLQKYFQHYAFPVLIAILLFYLFTQYIFDQVKKSSQNERIQIEHEKRLKSREATNLLEEAESATNSLDDAIILNAFKSKYSEQELKYKAEILRVEQFIENFQFTEAVQQLKPLMKLMPTSQRCLYASAYIIDQLAEREKSNIKLAQSIEIYKKLMGLNDLHKSLIYIAGRRLVNRLEFVGKVFEASSYAEMINRLIPENINILNDLAISYMNVNKLKLAKEKFEQVLVLDNNNTVAICHYAFILKTFDNRLHEAVLYFKSCLNTKERVAMDARFFYHLGDSLQRLNKTEEAYHYYKLGVENGFFNSVYQRSLFNEPNLRAQPLWSHEETGYEEYFKLLENNWLTIRNEAIAQINQKTRTFLPEDETLLNKGDWKQFNLYLRGKKVVENCQKMPFTCYLIDQIVPAHSCSRCQIKFSLMSQGAHVWPHCGPSNTRIRAHLGLVVPEGCCRMRVANETIEWKEGKIIVFDDSFEHEVWHNGAEYGDRLILIVDLWHPDLDLDKLSKLNPI